MGNFIFLVDISGKLKYHFAMTKKHFIALAQSIAKIPNIAERKALAESHAVLCAKSNPRFDKSRFFSACGL